MAENTPTKASAICAAVEEFVEGYEMVGEDDAGRDAFHTPTDGERALIVDAIHGLLADETFIALLAPTTSTVDAAVAQEPVIWVSPEQMHAHPDRDQDESGAYLPVRRTPRGKFTMPLYATPKPAASVDSQLAQVERAMQTLEDVSAWSAEDWSEFLERDHGAKAAAILLSFYGPKAACTAPPEGWSCSRIAGHEGPCAASPAASVGVRREAAGSLPSWWPDFIRSVAELPDRNSPEGDPEAMLASAEELEQCALAAIEDAAVSTRPQPRTVDAPSDEGLAYELWAIRSRLRLAADYNAHVEIHCKAAFAAGRATPPQQAAAGAVRGSDTALLDYLREESLDLQCFNMGEDDSGVGWRTVQHHMGKPSERVASEVYTDDPRQAIREAMARLERDPYCIGPLHLDDAAAIASHSTQEGGAA